MNGQTINTMELGLNLTRADNGAPIECRYLEDAVLPSGMINVKLDRVNRADSAFSILKLVSLDLYTILFYHLRCITFNPYFVYVFV